MSTTDSPAIIPVATNRELYARLLGAVKPYRKVFAVAVLAMAVGGAAQGAFGYFLKVLLDKLFVQGNEQYAWIAALGIVLIFLVSGLANFISGYGMQWVSTKVILDFRNQMFHRLIRLPEPFFSRTSTGTMMSKVTNDVMGLQEAATNALTSLVRGTFTIIIGLATMFILSWKLTLITFATVPILALIISAFGKRLRSLSRETQVAQAAITDVLEESIRGHKVIKVFGGERYELSRFDNAANRIRQLSMKHGAAAAAGTPFTQLIVSIAIALIVYLAASKTMGTGLDVSSFVAYIVITAGLVPQIKGLTSVSEQMQKGLAACESVFGLIDSPLEADTGKKNIDRAKGKLRFDAVSLQYENQSGLALDDVSIDIKAGETIALVGPSGGGKTSFMNLVPRFFTPTAGTITLDGHALADIKLTDLRKQIAMVSQDVVLFNDTVAANIAYGVVGDADMAKVKEAAVAAHCLDFIEALPSGFNTEIGDNGSRLSGGQRQRIAIARALYKDAPILLLDEATSALDSESERAVQTALDALMRGRTTLVVAHRLSTIEKADRILVLEAGKIVELGTHAELLLRGGLYTSLHRLQFSA
jgi:ATP-binding cassette, subfamily B, bacterial MsbA